MIKDQAAQVCKTMRPLGQAEFGAVTFCASTHSIDQCGANGLPLTPNSIKILGRFQELKAVEHPRLCKYLDILRCKDERLIVVQEYYKENLKNKILTGKYSEPSALLGLAYDVLCGLRYLNNHGLVNRSVCPQHILFDDKGCVKMMNYGNYHMTDYGSAVAFPIGVPKYTAPEVIAEGYYFDVDVNTVADYEGTFASPKSSGPKVDTWSLGIILIEALMGEPIWKTLTMQQCLYKIMGFIKSGVHPLETIIKDHQIQAKFQALPSEVQFLVRQCLTVSPSARPDPTTALKYPLFEDIAQPEVEYPSDYCLVAGTLRCEHLTLEQIEQEPFTDDHLSERGIDEVYHLWQLAGGDLVGTLKKTGLIRSNPPVTKIACYAADQGEIFGHRKDRSVLLDETVVILSQEQLRQRLEHVDPVSYYPLLEDDKSLSNGGNGLPTSQSNVDLTEARDLPLVIRERDTEYQFHRIMLYSRLLIAHPYKKSLIWKEARVDIPPLVRGHVWAALLDAEGDIQGRYDEVDKESPTLTDRQLKVDIPRCHQYNELLSSPTGRAKFKRVLKTWVVRHPEYVYWQGLDSLCAPFLHLHFNNEAYAFACLDAFIIKYLHKFFLKDNSAVIREYLAVFSHLIAFHEPQMSNHLHNIGFTPDLYAISWFLTMYAHVFPLQKIFYLWDTLLLGTSAFPLCIGVAILQGLKDKLMSFGFDECILLFSDMPDIDIERCVQDSIKIFCNTPKSATYRQHARQVKRETTSKPNVSYYSTDYNELPKSELSMEPVPYEELQAERLPRVSAEDLLELCDLSVVSSPAKKSSKPKIIVIDCRTEEEYMKGTIPGCINIPYNTSFNPDDTLIQCKAVDILNQHSFPVKAVVGGTLRQGLDFAHKLLSLNYKKLCVLHNGIKSLRNTGVLTVPAPEL